MKKKKHWKVFWENLGFSLDKLPKHLKKFKDVRILNALKRDFELTNSDLEKMANTFHNFRADRDKVNLIFFDKYFRSHNNSILAYFDQEDSKSIVNLLKVFKKKKEVFLRIHYHNLWVKGGRGFGYKIDNLSKQFSKLKKLRRGALNPSTIRSYQGFHEDFRQNFKDVFLFMLRKGTKKNSLRKFIAFSKERNKVYFSPTFSNLERYHILSNRLPRAGFNLDLSLEELDNEKLFSFLKGELEGELTFGLYGITLENNGVISKFVHASRGGPPSLYLAQEIKKNLPEKFDIRNLKEIILFDRADEKSLQIYRVQFNRYNGVIFVNLDSGKIYKKEYDLLLDEFKTQFGIEAEMAYRDPYVTPKDWFQEFLDKPGKANHPSAKIPPSGLEILLDLIDKGLLKLTKPSRFGWICLSRGCGQYGKLQWSKLKRNVCRICKKHKAKILDFIEYVKNDNNILNIIKKAGESEGFVVEKGKKQILNQNFSLIRLLNKDGDNMTIKPIYSKNELNYIKELCKRCSSVMILNGGVNLGNINEPIYEISLSEILYNYIKDPKTKLITFAFKDQLNKWNQKRINSFDQGVDNLKNALKLQKKSKSYKPVDLEIDVFNVLHYILPNAVWLGIDKSGSKLPDGLASTPSFMSSDLKGCVMWDCKLSFAKIGVNVGSYIKNKEYVKKMTDEPIIKQLGKLKGYIIITNNKHEHNFENIFKKLKRNLKKDAKEVQYSLLNIEELIKIVEFYREKEKDFEADDDKKRLFYQRLFNIFLENKISIISGQRVDEFIEGIEKELTEKKTTPPLLDREKFS